MATRVPPAPRRRRLLDRAKTLADLVLYRLGVRNPRFRGAFPTHAAALAGVRRGCLAGYGHDALADATFERMCRLELRDWPALYWLRRLWPEVRCVLDAGGHQGTKFRAFRNHLDLGSGVRWVVFDVPAVVRAGRARCARDGLTGLSFIDDLGDAPDADVFFGSGVVQYLDVPFADLLRRLPAPPRHLVLNKVATRPGPAVVTLEYFGCAEVPYQILNYAEFVGALDALGYDVLDEWHIDDLSYVIPTHASLGPFANSGFYARLRGASPPG